MRVYQVLLRRVTDTISFDKRNWSEYVKGFNDVAYLNMWIGLENAHRLTTNPNVLLRIAMTSRDGTTGVAKYWRFGVTSRFTRYSLTYGTLQTNQATGQWFCK